MVDQPPPILGVLAEPVRWVVVRELLVSDRRVGELVELVGKPQSLVSYHLAELRRAHVVIARRSSADGRDVYYRADLRRCRSLLAEVGESLGPALLRSPGRHRRQRASRVLFLCTGNSARSQIAAAIVAQRSGGEVVATSAGSHPKPLHPNAVQVMAERGVDIAGNRSTPIAHVARRRFDRVITLCDKVREVCPEFPGSPALTHWSTPDPAASGDDAATYPAFVEVADDLDARIDLLLGATAEHR